MPRTRLASALVLAFLAAGCGPDLGLDDNIPAEEAASKEPKPLVVATMMAEAPDRAAAFDLDGRTWVPSALPWSGPVPDFSLASIGSVEGRTLLAARWDQPPYDRLFTRGADGGLQEFVPVLGTGAPVHEEAVELEERGQGTADPSGH